MVVVAILAVYFTTFNQTVIQLNVFGRPLQGPSGLFMAIALGAGIVLGILIMLPTVIGHSWAVMRHRRRIQDLEDVISSQKQVEPYGDQ
jgi:uncharacterized integral membrane protein